MELSAITTNQWFKIFKTVVYVAISAGIAELIALIAGHPALFGPLTPVVNVLLVTLKQLFSKS